MAVARFVAKIFIKAAAYYLAEKGAVMAYDAYRKKKEEETREALECKIDEAFQELKAKMEALNKSFTKLQESRHCVSQLLRTELEKNQGKKEGNFTRVLLSITEKEIQMLSQRIQTLQKDVQEWPETTKYELQLLRADLEKNQGKKEDEISRALDSRLSEKFQQLFQIIETLEKDIQKLLESAQHEF